MNTQGPADPLERFEADLRTLRPRAVSGEARLRAAARALDPARSYRTPRVAGVALVVSGFAAVVMVALLIGPTGGRPDPWRGQGQETEDREISTPGGCECRVRFSRRNPARPVRTTGPKRTPAGALMVSGWGAAAPRLDPEPTAELRS